MRKLSPKIGCMVFHWSRRKLSTSIKNVGTPFFIESLLIIDPQQGFDQSPVLLNPPIDNACFKQVYNENPDANDPDGDSLVYKLIPPKQAHNVDVSGYFTPQGFILFSQVICSTESLWEKPCMVTSSSNTNKTCFLFMKWSRFIYSIMQHKVFFL